MKKAVSICFSFDTKNSIPQFKKAINLSNRYHYLCREFMVIKHNDIISSVLYKQTVNCQDTRCPKKYDSMRDPNCLEKKRIYIYYILILLLPDTKQHNETRC